MFKMSDVKSKFLKFHLKDVSKVLGNNLLRQLLSNLGIVSEP